MKRFWTVSVLMVLLISGFPVGLAQDTEPGSQPVAFQCGTGSLMHEEIQTLYDQLYGPFQGRTEVGAGPESSLEENTKDAVSITPEKLMEMHNTNTDPKAEGAKVSEGEIVTSDGQRKFNFNKNCISCDYLAFTSGTDTPYFACAKDMTTRVGYCDGGVGECLGNVSSLYGEKTGIISALTAPGYDQIMAKDDFKFYQRNGAFSPTDYDTLVYSDVQKKYDNYLPFATIVSIFVPNPVGVLQRGYRSVTSLGPWLKTVGRGKAEAKTIFKIGRTYPYFGSKGSDIIATNNYISGALARADELITAKKAQPDELVRLVEELGGRVKTMQDTVEKEALRNFEALTGTEKPISRISKADFDKALQAEIALGAQKGQKPAEAAKDLYESYVTYNIVQAQANSLKSIIARGLKEKSLDPKVAESVLKKINVQSSPLKSAFDALTKSEEVAIAELASILRKGGFQDTVSQNAEGLAKSIYDGYLKTPPDQQVKYVENVLKRYGLATSPGQLDEILAKPDAYTEAFAKKADEFLEENLLATNRLGDIEALTGAQQGKLQKLQNLLLGTTKTKTSTIARGVIYKAGFVYYVAHSPADRIGSQQLVFSISPSAKSREIIENYLDGEPPYVEILSHESSYLEGWHKLLSYIGVPGIFETWLSLMQARFSGFTGTRFEGSKEVEKIELESACRDDMYRVKDTAWTFRSGGADERFVVSQGTLGMSLVNGKLLVRSPGTVHSYTTEIEKKDCRPTIILKTHGVDMRPQVWKSRDLSADGIKELMNDFLGGRKDAPQVEVLGNGILIEDYIDPPAGEERCTFFNPEDFTSLFQDAGFGLLMQTIPLVDLATAPFLSKHMAECIDKDYWVHMMVNNDQDGMDILNDLFNSAESNVGLDTGESESALAQPTSTAEVAGSTQPGSAPTGSVVSEAYRKTYEGQDPISPETVIDGEGVEKEESYKGGLEGFIKWAENLGKNVQTVAEEAVREQELKKMNKNTFWLRGQYDRGIYGALNVKKCCYVHFAASSKQRPMTTEFKERSIVDSVSKKAVVMEKAANGMPSITINTFDKDGNSKEVLKIVDDMFRQIMDVANIGNIVPYRTAKIIIPDPESEDILFRSIVGRGRIKAELHAGDYGSSQKVTELVNCIVAYINGMLRKQYAVFDHDRALAELGEIDIIVLENGVQISKEDDSFILADPGRMSAATVLEIRLNREVLLDSVPVGRVMIIHTKNGQLMWQRDANMLSVWLYQLAEGEATKLAVDVDSTQKLESGVDSDGDGLTDSEEYALGTNPNNPDTDSDGVSDGDEDEDGDGVRNRDEIICNFHGFVLDLGPDLAEFTTLIGPMLSMETSKHTVTFVADDSSGVCRKYVRMCERSTGVCAEREEIKSIQVAANTISISTVDDQLKLLEVGIGPDGKPTLKSAHVDETGKEVFGPETFGPEEIRKIRGTNGMAFYDPNTGRWTLYGGFDIPRDPSFDRNGYTVAPVINNAPTYLPGDAMGATEEKEEGKMGNLLAELPWAPEQEMHMLAFIAFLLIATLLIRRLNLGAI